MAQQLNILFPDIAKNDSSGKLMVAYYQLIPIFIKSMQEQQKLINEQQKNISHLKKNN